MLVEEKTFYFEIKNNMLILTNSMAKDHLLNANLTHEGLLIDGRKIPNRMLNKLTIIYQDEVRLQCVIFHVEGINSLIYNVNDYLKKELNRLTGYQNIITDNVVVKGKRTDWNSGYLRDNTGYHYIFKTYNKLSQFIEGKKIFNLIFEYHAPEKIPNDTDTVIITDSYLENLDFLSCCDNLKTVIIERSIINNFTGLTEQKRILNLYLEAVPLPDYGIIKDMHNLQRVGLVCCDLKEVNGLTNKKDLFYCDISFNNFEEDDSSIESLFDSKKLLWLCLSAYARPTLNVEFWPELRGLEISYSKIKNIYNLQFCKKLQFIDCYSSNIENFYGIKGFSYDENFGWAVADKNMLAVDEISN